MRIRKGILAVAAALSMLLTACAATAPVPGEDKAQPAEAATEQATQEAKSREKDEFSDRAKEIEEFQEKAEKEAKTQTDMNVSSKEIYEKWETLHDDVFAYLENELSEAELDELRRDEAEWSKKKDEAVEKADKEYEGGSMAPMMHNTTASEYYKTRCYELIDMIR